MKAALGACLTLVTAGVALAADQPIEDYLRFRDYLQRGEFDRAGELADRLSGRAELGAMFLALPQMVVAERQRAGGDPLQAARLFERITPSGGCLVSYAQSYWNSCDKLAEIYGSLGNRDGEIEMRRRLTVGAGIRDGGSPARAYIDLARAYERAGDRGRASVFFRAAAHGFEGTRDRRAAVEGLERLDAPLGAGDDVILDAALSDDQVLRQAGLSALWHLADPVAAYDRLLQAGGDPERRQAAIAALTALPVDNLASRLHETLRSPDAGLRETAKDALRRMTGLTYPSAGPEGIDAAAFTDESYAFRYWGTAFLVDRLDDRFEADRVRLLALDAIGRIGDPRGLDAVLRSSDDPAPARRAHAVMALRAYKGDRVERALVARLEDRDSLVRTIAAAQIARRRLPEAGDLLGRAAAGEMEPWAAAAMREAQALAAFVAGGEPPATPLLDTLAPATPVLEPPATIGPSSSTAEIFDAALLGIPPPEAAIRTLLESDRMSEYQPAAIALANAGVRTHLGEIRRRARRSSFGPDGAERVSYDATLIEVLGWLQDDASAPLLREALESPHARGAAQAAAARGLGQIGDRSAIPLLVSTFTDPRSPEAVQRAAGRALAQMASADLGPVVLGGLESPNPRMRECTLLLLQETGSTFGREQVARAGAYDPDTGVRRLAASFAGAIPDAPPDPSSPDNRR
jgi:HEAT repeat protein